MTAATLLATVTGASAQQMSLPGNFAVNSSGAATYDIAIAVPPGTAGMVPSLKHSYTRSAFSWFESYQAASASL
jgi:hypothetical protein